MALKTTLAALALVMAPSFALAMCSGSKHEQAQSCAAGQAWDSASQSCKPLASS